MKLQSIFSRNKIQLEWHQNLYILILDRLGKTIFESKVNDGETLVHLAPGMYHLEINHDNGTLHQKILI